MTEGNQERVRPTIFALVYSISVGQSITYLQMAKTLRVRRRLRMATYAAQGRTKTERLWRYLTVGPSVRFLAGRGVHFAIPSSSVPQDYRFTHIMGLPEKRVS